jgi:cardiolipin synthase
VNLPNTISLCRFAIVPLMIWLIFNGDFPLVFWLFLGAALSDAADGYIAKRFDQVTVLGAYLDPIADKTLLVGVYFALGLSGALPSWLVILVVFRDFAIIVGWLLIMALSGPRRVTPILLSKINTLFQIVLAALVLAGLSFAVVPVPLIEGFGYAVALTTVASGLAYARRLVMASPDMESLP